MGKISQRQVINYARWYPFILIPFIGTIVFNIYPLLNTFIQSFYNMAWKFNGILNYKALFLDYLFKISFKNTILMGLWGLGLNIPFAFIAAYALNNVIKGRKVYQTILLLPMIVSFAGAAMLFKNVIFPPTESGIANAFLKLIGLQASTWYNDTKLIPPMVAFLGVWRGVNFNIIIIYAGLQAVPVTHYEAAELEGVSQIQKVFYVVLPGIRNIMVFVWINSCMSIFRRFAEVFALMGNNAQPLDQYWTMMFYIYQKSFSTIFPKEWGLASAGSMVLFIIIMGVTIINYLLSEDRGVLKGERND